MKLMMKYIPFLAFVALSCRAVTSWVNYYKIFDIDSSAPRGIIIKKYPILLKNVLSTIEKQKIADAYYVLSNPQRRQAYDEELRLFQVGKKILDLTVYDTPETIVQKFNDLIKRKYSINKHDFNLAQQLVTKLLYGDPASPFQTGGFSAYEMRKRLQDYLYPSVAKEFEPLEQFEEESSKNIIKEFEFID